jgi:sugar lactone lactonase YvrE
MSTIVSPALGLPLNSPNDVVVARFAGAVHFTFGGRDRDILFVTADTSIWAVLCA